MATADDVGRRIDAALAAVAGSVDASGSSEDASYFSTHRARFRRSLAAIVAAVPQGGRLLDIGGHFLHQTAALAQLGYEVMAVDLGAFADVAFVRDRAHAFGIRLRSVPFEDVAGGRLLPDETESFDGIVLCEVLEHITFNPIAFWRRARDLTRTGGCIYVTTPNALKLLSVLGALWGLARLRRIGLSVPQIFTHVTYGHHWKEYSARELRDYFAALSPDFAVTVHTMPFAADRIFPPTSATNRAKEALRRLGNRTSVFAEQLELVIRVTGHSAWLRTPPSVE